MRSKLLVILPALALALSGCKKESVEGPLEGCRPAGFSSYCASHSECCSFACLAGRCVQNTKEDGVCGAHGDCAAPRFCVGGRCITISCVDGGLCNTGLPCCSGRCVTNVCQPDQDPVAHAGPVLTAPVPIRIALQLTNASVDPDIGIILQGLAYLWAVSPATGATLSSTTDAMPTFTATTPGTYQVTLTASNSGGSDTDTIAIVAVNTPPEIDMPPDVPVSTYVSRNVPFPFTAGVFDADGGPITCTWSKKGPTATQYTHVSGPVTCAGASGMAAVGSSQFTLTEDEAGTWEVALAVDDSVNPVVSASRFISVQNDAPVLLPEPSGAKMPTRYGNVRSLDLVPLHGSVFDRNGDAVTWQWSMTGVKPVGSTTARFVPAAGNSQDVHFEPDEEGLYTLNLHVDDGHGGTADKAVDVIVGPYVLPLARVVGAAFVAGKIVLVGEDAGVGKVWIVNPAIPVVASTLTLSSVPTAVGVSQNGTQAVVARTGGEWDLVDVTTGTFSGASRPALGFEVSSVAWANDRVYATSAGGIVRRLIPLATTAPYAVVPEQPSSFPPISGVRAVGSATHLWVLGGSAGAGAITRYVVDSNNMVRDPVQNTATTLASASGMWLSATAAELFFGGKLDVHDADTTLVPHLGKLGTLPVAPTHVGTMDDGGTLVGVVSQATSTLLTRFSGAAFTETTPAIVLPFIGELGERLDPEGRFTFVTKVGEATTYYAIVAVDRGTTTATDDVWGLFTIAP